MNFANILKYSNIWVVGLWWFLRGISGKKLVKDMAEDTVSSEVPLKSEVSEGEILIIARLICVTILHNLIYPLFNCNPHTVSLSGCSCVCIMHHYKFC